MFFYILLVLMMSEQLISKKLNKKSLESNGLGFELNKKDIDFIFGKKDSKNKNNKNRFERNLREDNRIIVQYEKLKSGSKRMNN